MDMLVDLLERLEEALADLAVDGRHDLLERPCGSIEVLVCVPMNSRRVRSVLELLHGDR